MSYYRYITGVYKSYWPQLNRSLRSSSVPRHVPTFEKHVNVSRNSRASSVPPGGYYSSSVFITRNAATPFRDRSLSVPPAVRATASTAHETYHYTDFDLKVIDYMNKLERQDVTRSYISQTRERGRDILQNDRMMSQSSTYESPNFQSRYNFYDGNKHDQDYLYPVSRDVLGSWKHYNLSRSTLDSRNRRETSPLVSRELDRYFGTQRRNDFVGSVSSGCATDFRHYNYRRVPYLGGSDHYSYLNKTVTEARAMHSS